MRAAATRPSSRQRTSSTSPPRPVELGEHDEFSVGGGWVLPVVLLVPIYLPMLGVLQGIGLANNEMSHLGYEFLPRWLLRVPLVRWMNTSTFHNLHHTSLHGNYALMFRFWDHLFGTEVPSYEQRFLERGAALRATPEAATSGTQ